MIKKIEPLEWCSDFSPKEEMINKYSDEDYFILGYNKDEGISKEPYYDSDLELNKAIFSLKNNYQQWMIVPRTKTALKEFSSTCPITEVTNREPVSYTASHIINSDGSMAILCETTVLGTVTSEDYYNVSYEGRKNYSVNTLEDADFISSIAWFARLPAQMSDEEAKAHSSDLHEEDDQIFKGSKAYRELVELGWQLCAQTIDGEEWKTPQGETYSLERDGSCAYKISKEEKEAPIYSFETVTAIHDRLKELKEAWTD